MRVGQRCGDVGRCDDWRHLGQRFAAGSLFGKKPLCVAGHTGHPRKKEHSDERQNLSQPTFAVRYIESSWACATRAFDDNLVEPFVV